VNLHARIAKSYLINNVEDIVVYIGLILIIPICCPAIEIHMTLLLEKPQLKLIFLGFINIDIQFIFDQTKLLKVLL